MADNQNARKLINELSDKLGVSQGQLQKAAKQGDIQSVLKNLNSEQAKSIETLLEDPQKAKELLNTPQAQALFKLFGGD